MYIKLTRLDNSPIWINAAFVVTIEPRKGGGAVVVPIGDGLDYDVRETPEQVLAMVEGAPVPEVVPVPAPKSLAPAPKDVSPELEPTPAFVEPAAPSEAAAPSEEAAPAPEPVKRTTRSRAKAKDAAAGERPVRKTRAKAAKKPEPPMSEDQLARLRKMAPKSLRKLVNTLATQFGVPDAEQTVEALRACELITVDHEHIVWPVQT